MPMIYIKPKLSKIRASNGKLEAIQGDIVQASHEIIDQAINRVP